MIGLTLPSRRRGGSGETARSGHPTFSAFWGLSECVTRDVSRNLNDLLPDGRPVKRFYALQDFFVNYFNEDWMLEDNSPDAVVGRFKAEAANAVPAVLNDRSPPASSEAFQ